VDLEVDPVDPHIHVVDLGQRPDAERAGVRRRIADP
jgi:hypothetical protein